MARRDLIHLGEGFLMGGADIIPGVSGGTVALILGIYERLVAAISHFDLQFVKHIKQREWLAAARHVDLLFLGLLGTGILSGIVLLSGLMHWLLNHQLQHTFAAFFGMIAVSSYIVARMVRRGGVGAILYGIVGAVFAYWLTGLEALSSPPEGLLYIFACGTIAICAMILPGISGSFILLLLGTYTDITGAVKETVKGHFDQLDVLGMFALGAGIGLLGFSKFLKWLLSRYEPQTLALLCGFMIGSLRKVWPYKIDQTKDLTEFKDKILVNTRPDFSSLNDWLSLGILVVSGVLVLLLEHIANRAKLPATADGENAASRDAT